MNVFYVLSATFGALGLVHQLLTGSEKAEQTLGSQEKVKPVKVEPITDITESASLETETNLGEEIALNETD